VAGPPGDVIVSPDECTRAAPGHLLIKKSMPVVSRVADAVAKKWSVLELPEGRRYDVFQR
jgi:hypothetical protein